MAAGSEKGMGQRSGVLAQSRALLPMIAGNLKSSPWSAATIVGCILLVVLVLTAFLGMASGFRKSSESAGSESIAIVLGAQSNSEATSQITREAVELLRLAPGLTGFVSSELSITVAVPRSDNADPINATLRGMDIQAAELREGFEIVEGRMFVPGRRELVIGLAISGGMSPGDMISLAGQEWRVAGLFQLDSAVFENEFWGDLTDVQAAYRRENQFQSVRGALTGPDGLTALSNWIADDPRLELDARTERAFFQAQAEDASNLILYIGWPLAAILGIGCLAGVLNTMIIMLEGRRRSLRILAGMGFAKTAMMLAIILETSLLALTGGALGAGLMVVILDGMSASTVGAGYRSVSFEIDIDAIVIAQSFAVAFGIGVLGALFPAWRATKL